MQIFKKVLTLVLLMSGSAYAQDVDAVILLEPTALELSQKLFKDGKLIQEDNAASQTLVDRVMSDVLSEIKYEASQLKVEPSSYIANSEVSFKAFLTASRLEVAAAATLPEKLVVAIRIGIRLEIQQRSRSGGAQVLAYGFEARKMIEQLAIELGIETP